MFLISGQNGVVLELRTFVLKNLLVSVLERNGEKMINEMVRRELSSFNKFFDENALRTELIVYLYIRCT